MPWVCRWALLGVALLVSSVAPAGGTWFPSARMAPPLVESVFSVSQRLSAKIDRRFSDTEVTAPFGSFGQVDFSGSKLRTLQQSYGQMTRGTELRMNSENSPVAVCGPTKLLNEMVCLNQNSGEVLSRLPIPGSVSAAPLFHKGSWIVATTKGFVFRASGISEQGAPVLGMENLAFWGASSRDRMSYLREFYRQSESSGAVSDGEGAPSGATSSRSQALEFVQVGWNWYLWSSSEFVGHLEVLGSRIIGLTANQFVYAIDFDSGEIAWAQRVGTDEDLRIQSQALAVSANHVIVGSSVGQLQFLNPTTGQLDWQVELNAEASDRFKGITAKPLVMGQRVLVSAVSGETKLINERSKQVEWTLPVGSFASGRRLGDSVYLGASTGELLKVDLQSGKVQKRKILSRSEPVASLQELESLRLLLVALVDGSVHVLDSESLETVQQFASQGTFEGEFFGSDSAGQYCITTKKGYLRCFSQLKSR